MNYKKTNTRYEIRDTKRGILYFVVRISYLVFFLVPIGFMSIAGCRRPQSDNAEHAAHATRYHCPMHPNYISDRPGDCPICSMKLVPMEDSTTTPKEKKIRFYRNPMHPEVTSPEPAKDEMGMDYTPVYEDETASALPGYAVVRIDENHQQLIGVKLSAVEKRPLLHTIRATARVARDPELFSAIKEAQSVPAGDDRTSQAVRLRLLQMGLSENLIHEISRPAYDASFLLVAEPKKKVWVYVEIYADEANLVKEGNLTEFSSASNPNKKWQGRVRSIDRVIDRDTRTLRARAEVMNSDGELRSDMFLNATIQADLGTRLVIPATAIMDTGTRKLIYVQTNAGEFSPREVQTGFDGEGWVEVVTGAAVGEMVVTSANFLVDSESRIKGAR